MAKKNAVNKEPPKAEEPKEDFIGIRQSRLAELDTEVAKHGALQNKTKNELRELEKSLKAVEEDQSDELRGELAEFFAVRSEAGLIDQVLKKKMMSPKVMQVQENLSKLVSLLSWSEGQERRLRQEKQDCLQEIVDFQVCENIKMVYAQIDALITSYNACRGELEALKEKVLACRALDPEWQGRLNKIHTPEEITPKDRFTLDFLEIFRGGNLRDISLEYLLQRVGGWRGTPFHVPVDQRPETKIIRIGEPGQPFAIEGER